MHVNGNASASLTLNNSTLTNNAITCGPISCTGSGTKDISTNSSCCIYRQYIIIRWYGDLLNHTSVHRYYWLNTDYNGKLLYTTSRNDFKMYVSSEASPSLTLNSTTLTTNAITCGPISRTGSAVKPTQPTTAGVYVGLDSSAARGMEICCSTLPYIDFTTIGTDFKGRYIYAHADNSFNWQVGGSTSNGMKISSTGLSVTGTVTSSDKTLKLNDKPLANAISVDNVWSL